MRLARVATLRLAGEQNQARIAEHLGVSPGTISRDFAALDQRFQAQAAQDIATAKGLDLERIETLIRGLWGEAANGRWLAVDRVVALLARKAAMLGYDAPAKVDLARYVREQALALGLDPDLAVAEAERIIAERRGR